jgi:hypothetical protein
MHLGLLIFAVALFVLGVILVIASNFMVFALIEEINGRSLADKQIGLIFARMDEVLRRHRQLFPESPKRRQMYVVAGAGIVLGFVAFLLLILVNTK